MTATNNPNGDQGIFIRLPEPALELAFNLRFTEGRTFPQILRHLAALGYSIHGYDPALLNHHLRRHMLDTGRGHLLPRRAPRRTAAEARRNGRRFGAEIECKGLRPEVAAQALRDAGLNAQAEHYNHAVNAHWKVTTDGSLSGTACEVVSPPMTDTADLERAMKALRDAGGRIDRQCGLHIHHEVTDLSGAALAALIGMYERHQSEIDGLVSRSRRGRQSYLGPFHRGECARFQEAFRQVRDGEAEARIRHAASLGLGHRPESRYRNVNVHAFGIYGTIEFRQHQGTLNGRKATEWVRLGQAMIEAAKAATAVTAGNLLTDLAGAGHLPEPTRAYWARRAAALAA